MAGETHRKIVIDGVERQEVTESELLNEATSVMPADPTFEAILVRPAGWKPKEQNLIFRGIEYELSCIPFKADLSEDHDFSFEGCLVAYLRPKVTK